MSGQDPTEKPSAASASQGRLSSYIRSVVVSALNQPAATMRPATKQDEALVAAIHSYLIAEGEAPIVWDMSAGTPDLLHQQLADSLESGALARNCPAFAHGDDCTNRVNARARNAALGELMKAVYEHYAHTCGREPYAHEQLKLWKQTLEPAADGTWQLVIRQVDHIEKGERFVIGCNGVLGMHSAQKPLEDFFAQMRKLLGGSQLLGQSISGKAAALYCLTAPDDHRIRYAQEPPASNAAPESYVADYVRRGVRDLIVPVLGLPTDGSHLKPVELKQRFRQLNFFFNSHGTVVGKQIRNVLAETLAQQGYAAADIRQALGEAYAMNIHPTCRLDDAHPCGNFSSLYVVSCHDRTTPGRADYRRYVPHGAKVPSLIPISDNQLMVWTDHPEQGVRWEQFGNPQAYDAQGTIKGNALPVAAIAEGKSGHALRLATERIAYQGEEGLSISDPAYLAHALRHAMVAEKLPEHLVDMMDPVRLCEPDPPPEGTHPRPLPPSFRMMDAIRELKASFAKKQRE